jgi:hypothetical protein
VVDILCVKLESGPVKSTLLARIAFWEQKTHIYYSLKYFWYRHSLVVFTYTKPHVASSGRSPHSTGEPRYTNDTPTRARISQTSRTDARVEQRVISRVPRVFSVLVCLRFTPLGVLSAAKCKPRASIVWRYALKSFTMVLVLPSPP